MSLPEGSSIREGRRYRARSTQIFGRPWFNGDRSYPWTLIGEDDGCVHTFTHEGRYNHYFKSPHDLIEEIGPTPSVGNPLMEGGMLKGVAYEVFGTEAYIRFPEGPFTLAQLNEMRDAIAEICRLIEEGKSK